MIEIRSFRRVFDLERRIYSVDRLRLNPAGIPIRGVLYVVVAVFASLMLSALPLVGGAIRTLPWYLRDLGVPAAVATVLAVIRVDGRTFHLAALSLLRMHVGPRSVTDLTRRSSVGETWAPPAVLMLPDGSDWRLRRLRFQGPGAAVVFVAHDRSGVAEHGHVGFGAGRATLRVRRRIDGGASAPPTVIALERHGRLEILAGAAKRG